MTIESKRFVSALPANSVKCTLGGWPAREQYTGSFFCDFQVNGLRTSRMISWCVTYQLQIDSKMRIIVEVSVKTNRYQTLPSYKEMEVDDNGTVNFSRMAIRAINEMALESAGRSVRRSNSASLGCSLFDSKFGISRVTSEGPIKYKVSAKAAGYISSLSSHMTVWRQEYLRHLISFLRSRAAEKFTLEFKGRNFLFQDPREVEYFCQGLEVLGVKS